MPNSKTPKKQIQYTQEQLDEGLFKAIEGGYDGLVKVYIEKGANVHSTKSPDFRKSTPLHYAVRQGNLEIIKLLLEKNADVNIENSLYETPLATNLSATSAVNPFAIRSKISEMLIEKGANPKPILAQHKDMKDGYLDGIFGKDDEMLKVLMTYAMRDEDYKPNNDVHPRVKKMYARLREHKAAIEVAEKKGLPTELRKKVTELLGGKHKTKKSKKSKAKKPSKKRNTRKNKKNKKTKK